MKSTRALSVSVALATLLVAGGLVAAHVSAAGGAHTVAWSQQAGGGTVFPACGSAGTSAECATNGTAQETVNWSATGVHTGGPTGPVFSCTSVALNGSMGSVSGQPCSGSYTFSSLAPNTSYSCAMQASAVVPYGLMQTVQDDSTVDCSFTTPSCVPTTSTLSITKTQTSPGTATIVHPGDTLVYQINHSTGGNGTQTNLWVSDQIPPYTHLVSQNSTYLPYQGNAPGVTPDWFYWQKLGTSAPGTSGSIQVTVAVDANAPPGTQICNHAYTQSGTPNTASQVGPVDSSYICNTTVNSPPPVTDINATCNASGTSATISWSAAPGATVYYPRVWIPSGTCPAGWTMYTDNHTCYIGLGNGDGYAGGTSVVFPIQKSAQYNTWVHPGDPVNWASPPSQIFICNGAPDLTAGAVSPASATVSVPIDLTATISNSNTPTVNGFTDSFQINPTSIPGTFAGIQTIKLYASSALGANGSNIATASYTFPTTGTWYVRACADTDAANTGTIAESDETNNCGPWTAITIVPVTGVLQPVTGVTAACNASGTAVTISWNASPGATVYYPRVQIPSGSCPSGWLTSGSTCYVGGAVPGDGYAGGTSIVFPGIQPGVSGYSTWVHPGDPVNWNNPGGYVIPACPAGSGGPSLTCSRNPSTQSMPAPASITYTASSGGTLPPGTTYTFKDGLGNVLQSGTGTTFQKTYGSGGNYAVTVSANGVSGAVDCGVPVTVGGSCSGISSQIGVDPDRRATPGNITVSWNASGVSGSCIVTENGTTISTTPASSCTVSGPGVVRSVSSAQTTYCISCDGAIQGQPGYACKTVNVGGNIQVF